MIANKTINHISSFFSEYKPSFKNDTIVSFVGTFSSRLISFAFLPLLTIVYSPAEYGVWSLLIAAATCLMPLATLRYEIPIVLSDDDSGAIALSWLIICSSLCISILSGIPIYFFKDDLAEFLNLSKHQINLIFIVPLIVLLTTLQVVLHAWLTRKASYRAIAIAQISQTCTTTFLAILLPTIFNANAFIFIIASLSGLLAGNAVYIYAFIKSTLICSPIASLKLLKETGLKYKVYPLYMVPYSLSTNFSERIFQVLLATNFSVSTLGTYFVARQLVNTPMGVVTSSIKQVFFPYILREKDSLKRKKSISEILFLINTLQMPILAYGIIYLPEIITLIVGDRWKTLGSFVYWLIFPASALVHTEWLDRMYDICNKQKFAVFLQVISDASLLAVIIYCIANRTTELDSVAYLSITIAAYNILWLWITLLIADFAISDIILFFVKSLFSFILYVAIFTLINSLFSFLVCALIGIVYLSLHTIYVLISAYTTTNKN